MNTLVEQFFNLEVMRAALPLLLKGLGMTLLICLAVVPLGLAAGLGLALAQRSRRRAVRIAATWWVHFFRSLPPLVLLIFVYSGLPFVGLRLSPFAAVVLAFVLNNSTYYAEILRAGLISVPPGQAEAARSTGLNALQALVWVVVPQAVRNVLPDLASNTVEVVKTTSLASVVTLGEMLHAADMVRAVTYNASPYMLAALIYLAILWPAVRLIGRLENRVQTA